MRNKFTKKRTNISQSSSFDLLTIGVMEQWYDGVMGN